MKNHVWINDLNELLAMFSELGLNDVVHMNLSELWGVYRYLTRLKDMRE